MIVDRKLGGIIARFEFEGELAGCEEIKTGHINSTYALRFALPEGGERKYLLQLVNGFAFKRPEYVMENVQLVTEHLRAAMLARDIDPANRVLRLVPTREGGVMLPDAGGGCWRAYDFITHAHTVDHVDSPAQFREIGAAFGQFQNMLADFPIERLHETIPDFHDTRKRLEAFEASVAAHGARTASVPAEIAFVRARKAAMCRIVEMIEAGELPLRVTHNDTKINNVMLDVDTGRALCVVDLDTVMAGSVLYDFGDAIRYGASTADEDERDLSKVAMDIELFRAFSEGFIAETADRLTEAELVSLPLGALVMTFEVGLRFLTDYLDGNVYFHTEYDEHNLVRARCQFRLLEDMERQRADMDRIVRELVDHQRG